MTLLLRDWHPTTTPVQTFHSPDPEGKKILANQQ